MNIFTDDYVYWAILVLILTPPPNQFPDLEYFINSSRKALPSSGYSFQSHKSNLSSQELSTIKSLSNRTDIVIRKADKDSDPTSSYQKQVSKTIGNFISSGDLPVFAQRLIEKNPRCSVFYLNPKIHKYGNPGRPIVSTVCCPTSLISAFVDSVLQPLVANTPTYLKDTTHMLQLLENFIFPVDPASCPTFLVTCDVAQLYTVIPHAGGLTAAKVLFESRSVLDPPTHVLIRLLELVLTLNAFEFNSEFFSQISGVAMGTKVGPSYACCFLAHQEFLFFARYSGPMPVLYKRFIDDIFMIFQSPDTDVTIFLDAMSTMHPSLKFETTISSSSICFLDLKISIRDHKILTSIYYKPTDSHSYLPYDSCHPKHVLDSIPYSQFLRLRRICSDDDDFLTQSFTMSQFFSHRGYPSHLIRRTLEAVKAVSRSSLLVPHDKSTKDIVPLVVGYSPNVTTVVQKTKSLFNSILSHNPNFSSKPIVAYRRAPNLQQLLVRSKLKPIGDSILQDSTTFGETCNLRVQQYIVDPSRRACNASLGRMYALCGMYHCKEEERIMQQAGFGMNGAMHLSEKYKLIDFLRTKQFRHSSETSIVDFFINLMRLLIMPMVFFVAYYVTRQLREKLISRQLPLPSQSTTQPSVHHRGGTIGGGGRVGVSSVVILDSPTSSRRTRLEDPPPPYDSIITPPTYVEATTQKIQIMSPSTSFPPPFSGGITTTTNQTSSVQRTQGDEIVLEQSEIRMAEGLAEVEVPNSQASPTPPPPGEVIIVPVESESNNDNGPEVVDQESDAVHPTHLPPITAPPPTPPPQKTQEFDATLENEITN
ncbi:hypothetical protein Fcan01_27207 [Folsomia candida]|uniref:Helix-turn-helix domain-containing protein n=1 Tax=Folsomia candida TaxID=158441 RepID=A0A226D151_FOLCA|nr:hypothetical protein Fcan01_27207 [Folsomia candida]